MNTISCAMPLVSVIVPIYQVEPYLEKCLDSITGQTYSDLEIILVDDGSPDRCGQICDEYAEKDPRVQVIHQENRGLSAARNAGLKRCGGELVSFIDSDDWVEPDMIEKLVSALTKYDADACRCRYYIADRSGERIHSVALEDGCCSGSEMVKMIVEGGASYVVWNALWKRELFTSDCFFPSGRNFEDMAIIWKLFGKCSRVACIPDVEIHHLARSGSIFYTKTAKNLCDRIWACREFYHGVAGESEPIKRSAGARCVSLIAREWPDLFGPCRKDLEPFRAEIEEMTRFVDDHRECWPECSWRVRMMIPLILHSDPATTALSCWINRIYRLMRREDEDVL